MQKNVVRVHLDLAAAKGEAERFADALEVYFTGGQFALDVQQWIKDFWLEKAGETEYPEVHVPRVEVTLLGKYGLVMDAGDLEFLIRHLNGAARTIRKDAQRGTPTERYYLDLLRLRDHIAGQFVELDNPKEKGHA